MQLVALCVTATGFNPIMVVSCYKNIIVINFGCNNLLSILISSINFHVMKNIACIILFTPQKGKYLAALGARACECMIFSHNKMKFFTFVVMMLSGTVEGKQTPASQDRVLLA